jgi:flavin-dependent dehydrogenase
VLFEGERAVGVRLSDDAGTRVIEAPIVVDASGRGSMLAARFRGKTRLEGLDQSAMFAHYRGVARGSGRDEGHIRIVIFDHGWMWLIPFRGDVTSVGAVVSRDWMDQRDKCEDLDSFFERTMALAPYTTEMIADAERISPVRAAADFSYAVSRYAGDGWLCVGDSCGFIDPLFSTGAHLAIKGAELAAEAIDRALSAGDLSRPAFAAYEDVVRSASSLFLGIVQAFYQGEFREMLFDSEQRRTLRQVITSMLSGDVVHNGRSPTWVRFVRARFPARYA